MFHSWAMSAVRGCRSRQRLHHTTLHCIPLLGRNKSVILLSTCFALVSNSCLQPVTINQSAAIMAEEAPIPIPNSTVTIEQQQCSEAYFSIAYICRLLKWTARYTALSLHLTALMMTMPVLLLGDLLHNWWWSFLRTNICSAGPSFIKFSQWAATRPDLFSDTVCAELSLLQSQTVTHSWAHTEAVLCSALGPQWSQVIQVREADVIGSGSVAQVYKATLMIRGGRRIPVALKVLHPAIRQSIEADLFLLRSAAQAVESIGGVLLQLLEQLLSAGPRARSCYPLVCVSVRESMDQFSSLLGSQLDLQGEGAALERLHDNFKGSSHVVVPTPWLLYKDEATDEVIAFNTAAPCLNTSLPDADLLSRCTPLRHPDLLIETFEEGVPMLEVLRGSTNSASHDRFIAGLGLDIILKMVFEDNYVHADLHAGNILVRYDKPLGVDQLSPATQPKIVLLDAGLMVQLQPHDKKNFVSLFKAVLDNNGREAARLMMEHMSNFDSTAPNSDVKLVVDPEGFQDKMAALVDDVHRKGLLLSNISVGSLLKQVLQHCYEHHVKLESRYVSTVLSIILAEGMGRQLDPDINIIERARPFIIRAAMEFIMS